MFYKMKIIELDNYIALQECAYLGKYKFYAVVGSR